MNHRPRDELYRVFPNHAILGYESLPITVGNASEIKRREARTSVGRVKIKKVPVTGKHRKESPSPESGKHRKEAPSPESGEKLRRIFYALLCPSMPFYALRCPSMPFDALPCISMNFDAFRCPSMHDKGSYCKKTPPALNDGGQSTPDQARISAQAATSCPHCWSVPTVIRR